MSKAFRLKCNFCMHLCELAEEEVGFCGVIQNSSGKLTQLNKDMVILFKTDSINQYIAHFEDEKALIISYLGSNFKDTYDQNWSHSQLPLLLAKQKSRDYSIKKVKELGTHMSAEKIVKYIEENSIEHVHFTISEPTVNWLSIKPVLESLQDNSSVKTSLKTNGYMSELTRNEIVAIVDHVQISLNSMDREFYLKHSKADLDVILANIQYFSVNSDISISTLLIPDENDSKKQLQKIIEFIFQLSPDIPWQIEQFRPEHRMLDKPITPIDSLKKAKEIALDTGLNTVNIVSLN